MRLQAFEDNFRENQGRSQMIPWFTEKVPVFPERGNPQRAMKTKWIGNFF